MFSMIKNKDIAEQLNISTTAVSLAINNKPGVSRELREKILALRNDSIQRTLDNSVREKTGEKERIMFCVFKKTGDIITDIPFFMNLTETLSIEASRLGYELLIAHFTPSMELEEYLENIKSANISGLLILGTEATREDIEEFKKLNIPMVLIDNWFPGISVDSVYMDNLCGMASAVRYFFKHGHTDIGYVDCKYAINNFKERLLGYSAGLKECGLPFDEAKVYVVGPSSDQAYRDFKEILDRGVKLPTALLVCNDQVAIGVMRALKEKGCGIPDDISLIGFDDMSDSHNIDPPLTSIHLHFGKIASFSAELLQKKIEGTSLYTANVRHMVSVDLVARKSVRSI